MTAVQRFDQDIIVSLIPEGSRVLDLGCGNGDLLTKLKQKGTSDIRGVEIEDRCIAVCVRKGLTVFHGDIDDGLKSYPDKSFDFVILNQSLQEMLKIDYVVDEALRVGKKVIIGFPNFAHISSRLKLLFLGKAPVTENLPYSWYDTPNIRFLGIKDFKEYCRKKNMKILSAHYLGKHNKILFLPNLFAEYAIFVVKR